MKYFILANPESGLKKTKSILKEIIEPKFNSSKINFYIKMTEYPGHASKIIAENDLSGYDAIIVLGGDGTIHETVNGMLKNQLNNIPIGIVPSGSGNSLIHDFGEFNPNNIIDKIMKNTPKGIDILEVINNDKKNYSINLIGWGMGTDIGILAEKMRWIGPMRYNIASLIKIFTYSPRQASLIIDDNEIKSKFALLTICNTIHVGKGMKMAPKAKLNDGKMDIIFIENNLSRIELLKLFPTIFSGKHINNVKVSYIQAEYLKLIPRNNEILNIDGEVKGSTPIEVKVIKSGIKILN